jgi:hypothetical protein
MEKSNSRKILKRTKGTTIRVTTITASPKNIRRLQKQIKAIQTELDNIQITPGPQGDPGPGAPQGEFGPEGPSGLGGPRLTYVSKRPSLVFIPP